MLYHLVRGFDALCCRTVTSTLFYYVNLHIIRPLTKSVCDKGLIVMENLPIIYGD